MIPDARQPGDARPQTDDEKAFEEWGRREVKVRLATLTDRIQYMHTVKDGYGKKADDLYDGVSDTEERRRDWDRPGLTKKKIRFKQMDITFMALTPTNNTRGEMVSVGLRHGNANVWDPADVVDGAVDEMDVPVRLLIHLRENVNKGYLYVEDTEPDKEPIPRPLARPHSPEAAKIMRWDAKS